MRRIALGLIAIAVAGLSTPSMFAQDPTKRSAPLPLDVVVAQRGHNSRSPINFSPDGEWIAHTIQGIDRVPRDVVSRRYSATGFPFAEGDARMEATLSNVQTGEVIRLGAAGSASWAPVWSPSGERVAFYSDEGGAAGIWVWERATRRASRVPNLVARPFFGFETPTWTPDSERLVVKVLPQGVTIAQANAREPGDVRATSRFPPVPAGQASVFVRRVDPAATPAATRPGSDPAAPPRVTGDQSWANVDLVIIDVRSGQATRLAERARVQGYALSPDGLTVAYTVNKGALENTQQAVYDLVARPIAGGAPRTLANEMRLTYGIEWSWSPDSRSIAAISSGQVGDGKITLHPLAGAPRVLPVEGAPSFDPGDGEYAPLWDGAETLYAIGGGALWRIDAGGKGAARVAAIPGWRMSIVVSSDGHRIWTADSGRTAWVLAREETGARSGIFSVDLRTGDHRAALQEPKAYASIFNVDVEPATGRIAFVSSGLQHLAEISVFETTTAHTRQVSRVNDAMDRYQLGTARVINWKTADGQQLRGALLLPTAYRAGLRVPLVVWVYGGTMGSTTANTFGLAGSSPVFNMHVLATRGYAVLFPDAPVRPGTPMADVMRAVMPGVDAAIEQGYADPDRLAVMGQSYGSYNVLAIITQTNRFKAAVITGAVLHPDLATDYLRATGYYEKGQGNMGATLWQNRARFIDNSPLYAFDRIQTPLLIGQGERDGDLVPSEAIFAALSRLEKPVEFRLYEGEGHVITRTANVVDFWQRRLEFLARHLDVAVDAAGAVIFDTTRARSRG